jgi:xanthine/uracil permease
MAGQQCPTRSVHSSTRFFPFGVLPPATPRSELHPRLFKAVPLGIQHVLAMFVANVTPAIIVCRRAGFGFGSNALDFPEMIYMIQMSMLLPASPR